MKRSGRLNPWGRFPGLVLFGILIIGLGRHSTQADAISLSQAVEFTSTNIIVKNIPTPDQNGEEPIQGNLLGLEEGSASGPVIARGSFELDTLVQTDSFGGGYRNLEGPIELSFYPEGGPATGSGSIIYEAWGEGCPHGRFEHTIKFTGSSASDGTAIGTADIVQYINKVEKCVYDSVEIKLTLSWEAHFKNGIFEGQILNSDGSTLPFTLTYSEEPAAPPVDEEPAAPPVDEDSFIPPESGETTDFSMDMNMVSPAGQAAAAAATTALLAAWLFMESQGTTQSSSTNDLVDTILRETNYYDPAEAGHYLAANTADILDHLNKPPVRTAQPSTPLSPVNSQPDTSYYGPPGHPEVEIFDGLAAYNILHALQLIPAEVPPNGQFQFNRADLDRFLNGHPDGVPQQIKLPNGNVIAVGQVQGITFEDRQGDSSDQCTIDFNRGIAIAVNVIKPDVSLSAEDLAAAMAEQAGQQGNAQSPGQRSENQASQSGLPDQRPGEQPSDVGNPDEPPRGESPEQRDETTGSGDQAGQGPMDEGEISEPSHGELIEETQEELQSVGGRSGQRAGGEETPVEQPGSRGSGESPFEGQGMGGAAGTDTPDEMSSETGRSFGDTGRSDSQGQVPGERISEGTGGRGSIGGSGSQGFDDGTGSGEMLPEPGDAEDREVSEFIADQLANAEPLTEDELAFEEAREEILDRLYDPLTPPEEIEKLEDQLNLFDRVDNVLDDIGNRDSGMEGGSTAGAAGGGESGGSQAGIIDGGETESATGDL